MSEANHVATGWWRVTFKEFDELHSVELSRLFNAVGRLIIVSTKLGARVTEKVVDWLEHFESRGAGEGKE